MISSTSNSMKTTIKLIEASIKNARLVAVSKTKPVEQLKQAYDYGIRHFGENYVDELVSKYKQLPNDINWHFIGHLQTNKVKMIMIPNLYVIETIDSIKLAEKVNKNCQKISRKELKVFVQILTSDQDTQHGIQPDKSFQLIEFILSKCPNLKFSGLMTIGKQGDIDAFKSLSKLRKDVCEQFELKENEIQLSMGMSGDYELAVQYGSTNVRVGSQIFGERSYPAKQVEEKPAATTQSEIVQ